MQCLPWLGCTSQRNLLLHVTHYDGHSKSAVEVTPEEYEAGWTDRWDKFPAQSISKRDTCETVGWVQRAQPRRVWDAFTFFNELQVLRLRFHTLAPVVHRFVLAEATKTHSNQAKRLHFNESRHEADIAPFLPQVSGCGFRCARGGGASRDTGSARDIDSLDIRTLPSPSPSPCPATRDPCPAPCACATPPPHTHKTNLSQVEHVIITDLPDSSDRWTLEMAQVRWAPPPACSVGRVTMPRRVG